MVNIKTLAALVAGITIIAGAVITTGGWFSDANEAHTWSDRARKPAEPTLDILVAQVKVNTEANEQLTAIEAKRARVLLRKEARVEQQEENCLTGRIDNDDGWCDKRGFEVPDRDDSR